MIHLCTPDTLLLIRPALAKEGKQELHYLII